MIIEIKKAKITPGIMAQVQDISVYNTLGFVTIGWCVYKNIKYIILHDPVNKRIGRMAFWDKINRLKHSFEIIGVNDECNIYRIEDDLIFSTIQRLKHIKLESIKLGQFFI